MKHLKYTKQFRNQRDRVLVCPFCCYFAVAVLHFHIRRCALSNEHERVVSFKCAVSLPLCQSARLAQSVEHQTFKAHTSLRSYLRVKGSSPLLGVTFYLKNKSNCRMCCSLLIQCLSFIVHQLHLFDDEHIVVKYLYYCICRRFRLSRNV